MTDSHETAPQPPIGARVRVTHGGAAYNGREGTVVAKATQAGMAVVVEFADNFVMSPLDVAEFRSWELEVIDG